MGRRKEQLMNFSRNPATTTVIPGLGKKKAGMKHAVSVLLCKTHTVHCTVLCM